MDFITYKENLLTYLSKTEEYEKQDISNVFLLSEVDNSMQTENMILKRIYRKEQQTNMHWLFLYIHSL